MAKRSRRKHRKNSCNCHHLLYQRRYWRKGYAKALRNHPYFKITIPANTLHAQIHRELESVDVPDNWACRTAYIILVAELEKGKLSLEDSPCQKLDFLISLWEEYFPRTASQLKIEREIIFNFYNK